MKKALICILTLACGFIANAGSLRVVYLNGSEVSYALESLRKVDFSQSGSASIVDNSGNTLKTESLSSLKRLDFTETATGAENVQATAKVQIYPNPTQDALNISGANAGDVIELYNMNGQAVYTGKATDGNNTVSMSSLSKATYVLRVGNQVVKIVKE